MGLGELAAAPSRRWFEVAGALGGTSAGGTRVKSEDSGESSGEDGHRGTKANKCWQIGPSACQLVYKAGLMVTLPISLIPFILTKGLVTATPRLLPTYCDMDNPNMANMLLQLLAGNVEPLVNAAAAVQSSRPPPVTPVAEFATAVELHSIGKIHCQHRMTHQATLLLTSDKEQQEQLNQGVLIASQVQTKMNLPLKAWVALKEMVKLHFCTDKSEINTCFMWEMPSKLSKCLTKALTLSGLTMSTFASISG
ncbi:hypothetical protein K438DRAFT_1946149 [Mycena galopus ATCC 62051]|nr:hypothetical protein K438DRAFT_1946149 [Mycena galopus ATCC 62051]